MNRVLIRACVLLLLGLGMIAGCDEGETPTLPPASGGGGFTLQTLYSGYPGVPVVPIGGITVRGDWQSDGANAGGDPSQINVTTLLSPIGVADLSGKRAPATWKFTWIEGADPTCTGVNATGYVYVNAEELFSCYTTVDVFGAVGGGFGFDPTPVYSWSPPDTATINGTGFDVTYGWPIVQYYTMDGTLVAQDTASYVSSDGAYIEVPGGDISQLYDGTYVGFVSNAGPDSTWTYLGTTAAQVVSPNVTISGTDNVDVVDPCAPDGSCPYTVPDWGTVWITTNGSSTYSVTYCYDDPEPNPCGSPDIANALADAINADPNAPVTAVVVSPDYRTGTVYFTEKSSGSLTSLTAGSSNYDTYDFPTPSYLAAVVGP